MNSIFAPELHRQISFFLYRYRFLLTYIFIGFLSIALEVISFKLLEFILGSLVSKIIAVTLGIVFAFWLNVRYNFKIPKSKWIRTFLIFSVISIFSFSISTTFKQEFQEAGFSYAQARFLSSGLLFFIAYLLHRKFSFKDFKQVAVAIYANGIEDIQGIFNRVGPFPDIIHVDIIDDTYGKENHDTKTYRLEVKKAYWPNKPLHLHIMSKKPSHWIESTASYADLIIFHLEIDEDIHQVIQLIRKHQRQVGIAITMQTDVKAVRPYLKDIDTLMLLTIPIPGHSGQSFAPEALEKLRTIESWPERSSVSICIDGGVNETNIHKLPVEMVVSGSSVLCHSNPPQQIMRLQTSNGYESVETSS